MPGPDAPDASAPSVEADGDEIDHTEAGTPPGTPPAIDHLPEPRTPDANHPTTGADPLPSGASPAPADGVQVPQITDHPSFVRHCPSSTNRDAYNKKSGRQLAPLLIDESGMGPRFHLLDNEIFSARITGKPPSEAARKKFKSPKLKKGMLERDIYPQLGAVIDSVLKAAKCKKLRFLDTANHKANDGNRGRTETFNDAGLYRTTEHARDATDLDPERLKKSKMSREQLEARLLGARSWFWMDVPVEVKGDEKNSAFYFKTKPKKGWKKHRHPAAAAAASSSEDERPEDAEDEEGSVQQEGEDEEVEEVGEAEGGGDVVVMEEEVADQGGDEVGEGENDEVDEDEDESEDEGEVDDDDDDDDEDEEDEDDENDEEGDEYGFDDLDYFEESGEDEDVDFEDEEEAPEDQENPTGIIKKSVPPFIKLSDNGEKALGQFVEYHLNLFKYQHRTFCYSIYICFDMARLLYFDRAGAYVSEPFSWVEPTSLLHEFVWKFAKLANANKLGDMGHDTTAKMVPLPTRRRFIREAKNPDLAPHVRSGLLKAADSDCPLYKLTVKDVPPSRDEWFPDEPFPEPPPPPPSEPKSISKKSSSSGSAKKSAKAKDSTPPPRKFIVGRPHFSADALVGRCTKGYMAFDVTNPKKWVPCFLKDSWRPCVRGRTRPEHLVYERLKRKGVKPTDGIATLICGGDVGGSRAQLTRVQEDLPDHNKPVLRVHYRLVIEDIGLPLHKFHDFGDLSGIFVDVLRAHYKILKRAKVLHRDVSVGNIMIRVDEDGGTHGFLIDWDLSRLESELGNGPVEPDRTGTWQFRSALSLHYPRKPYRRSDDFESFIHVYLYLVLRYHETLVSSVKDSVMQLFEQVSLVGGVKVGGDAKLNMIDSAKPPFKVASNPPLQDLVIKLVRGCSFAYSQLDLDAMDRVYGPDRTLAPRSPNPSSSSDTGSSPPRPGAVFRARARRMDSDDEMSEASDDDEVEKALGDGDEDDSTHRSAQRDLCTLGTFLTNPRNMTNLFAKHSQAAMGADDKGRDQFAARRHQDVLVPLHMGSRGIATLSVSASVPSEEGLPAEGLPEHDMFGTAWKPSDDVPPPSSSPTRSFGPNKRVRPGPSSDAEDDSVDTEEERRRAKRAKGKGRARGMRS
ncbi:hypothetical protein GSI_12461 [Ganoderma sinense ZZ0214-1]|uniref:Fungal-type protein kinase domain-containing protein n=1 Tax=Ganoderma sinense ZZ0214-1 TaxID=1077348 RepID=A0A2G8RST7_9APHY|nr:hypothetical protein GSI_12461 [Ganoderma sinense ZZ0214-1]